MYRYEQNGQVDKTEIFNKQPAISHYKHK